MILESYLDLIKKQIDKIKKTNSKKGVILRVNNNNVDVRIEGDFQSVLYGIPLAKHINISSVKVGDRCKVDFFNENNPNDAVVAYLF